MFSGSHTAVRWNVLDVESMKVWYEDEHYNESGFAHFRFSTTPRHRIDHLTPTDRNHLIPTHAPSCASHPLPAFPLAALIRMYHAQNCSPRYCYSNSAHHPS